MTSRPSTCTPACSPRTTSCGADVAVVSRARATSARARRWGFSGRRGRRGGQRRGDAGRPAGLPRCGSPRPTRASGTAGVSHHSLTAYGRVALVPADVPVPLLPGSVRRAGARPGARTGRPRSAGRLTAARGRDRTGSTLALRGPPGAAVDDGPRPGRGPRRPSSRGRRRAVCRPVCWRADCSGRSRCAQRTSTRSTTKISVSPGLIAPPAPRSP